jgi:hypothetical protein
MRGKAGWQLQAVKTSRGGEQRKGGAGSGGGACLAGPHAAQVDAVGLQHLPPVSRGIQGV